MAVELIFDTQIQCVLKAEEKKALERLVMLILGIGLNITLSPKLLLPVFLFFIVYKMLLLQNISNYKLNLNCILLVKTFNICM